MVKSGHVIAVILGVAAVGIGAAILYKKTKTSSGQNIPNKEILTFSIIPNSITIMDGSSIQFSVSAVSNGALPYSYQWEFGDGVISDDSNPAHIFSGVGIYKVKLTIIDIKGNFGNATSIITVVANTLPITMSQAGSSNPLPTGGSVGTTTGSSGAMGTTTGPSSGGIPVTSTLGITQGTSISGSYSGNIIFPSISPDQIYLGTLFSVSATQIIGGIGTLKFSWDFGDGSTAIGETVSHTYIKTGVYTIKLNVRDSFNNFGAFSTTLNIQEAPLQTKDVVLRPDNGNTGGGYIFSDQGVPHSFLTLIAYAHNNRLDRSVTVRMVIDLTDNNNITTTFYSQWITVLPNTTLKFPNVPLKSIQSGTSNTVSILLDSSEPLKGIESYLDTVTVSVS